MKTEATKPVEGVKPQANQAKFVCIFDGREFGSAKELLDYTTHTFRMSHATLITIYNERLEMTRKELNEAREKVAVLEQKVRELEQK